MKTTYTDWKQYLIDQNGDLRALSLTTADWLLDIALNRGDEDMVQAIEAFLGA